MAEQEPINENEVITSLARAMVHVRKGYTKLLESGMSEADIDAALTDAEEVETERLKRLADGRRKVSRMKKF